MWKLPPRICIPPNYETIKTIHLAAKCGQIQDVQKFVVLDKNLVHANDDYDNSALYYACVCGHVQVVRYLSEMGARDDKFNRCFISALNLQVREVLREFNVYSGHFETSSKNANVKFGKSLEVLFQNEVLTKEQGTDKTYWLSDITICLPHDTQDGTRAISTCAASIPGDVFFGHMLILFARCKAFRGEIVPNASELSNEQVLALGAKNVRQWKQDGILVVTGIAKAEMKIILQYMYTHTISEDDIFTATNKEALKQNVFKLLLAVQFLQIPDLLNMIMYPLLKKQQNWYNDICTLGPLIHESATHCYLANKVHIKAITKSFDHVVVYSALCDVEKKIPHAVQPIKKDKAKKKDVSKLQDELKMQKQKLQELEDRVMRVIAQETADVVLYTRYLEEEATPEQEFAEMVSKYTPNVYQQGDSLVEFDVSTPVTPSTPFSALPHMQVIFGNRALLAYRSEYFKMLLTGPFNDYNSSKGKIANRYHAIDMEEIAFSTLLHIVQYIYCDEIQVDSQIAIDMLFSASKFDMQVLKTKCQQFLLQSMDKDTCTAVYCIAEVVQCEQLQEQARQFMVRQCLGNPQVPLVEEFSNAIADYFTGQSKLANRLIDEFISEYKRLKPKPKVVAVAKPIERVEPAHYSFSPPAAVPTTTTMPKPVTITNIVPSKPQKVEKVAPKQHAVCALQ